MINKLITDAAKLVAICMLAGLTVSFFGQIAKHIIPDPAMRIIVCEDKGKYTSPICSSALELLESINVEARAENG